MRQFAHKVCRQLDNGKTIKEMMYMESMGMMGEEGPSPADAAEDLTYAAMAGVRSFCPEHESAIDELQNESGTS